MKAKGKNKGSDKRAGNQQSTKQSQTGLKNKAAGNPSTVSNQEPDKIKRSRGPAQSEKTAELLDETLRNDIYKTDLNPNAIRREPTIEGAETEEEKQLNKDQRVVNQQEDAIKRTKYNGL
jgi:hypothetical protein